MTALFATFIFHGLQCVKPSKVVEEKTRTALHSRPFGTVSWHHIQGPRTRLRFLTLEDGTHNLYRDVGKELPLHAV